MSTPPVPSTGTALLLSVFPGLGLLDAAFEREGFCVVRGPDIGLESIDAEPGVTTQGTVWDPRRGGPKVNVSREALRKSLVLQGLPAEYLDHAPLTVKGAMRMVGNGVPLPLGRAVARAIREALPYTSGAASALLQNKRQETA